MFLRQVKAKGNRYLYLCCYYSDELVTDRKILYSFGRTENALNKMQNWSKDFTLFPNELKALGCEKEDLDDWIRTLKTGITKTGRRMEKTL